ncbi:HNH endonuclease [Candidatus Pacearchaeota archaeon]|jgi:hypothetical protein|nr:HNH endonuclease [Candidatus Pacearchaeota archaeon]
MAVQKKLIYGILDDVFSEAVLKSKSWVDVCDRLKVNSENRKWAKKRAVELGLDYKHFGFVELHKKELEKIVMSSNSYLEVQNQISKSAKYTRKLIKDNNISTKHFPRIKSRRTKENISDERIIKLVNKLNSVTAILNTLGLCESKENYQWIRNKCKDLKLRTKFKIDWANWGKDKILSSLDKLKHVSTSITNKLIKCGFKKNECEICGQKPMHHNKPLMLQCHHIDGHRNNNTFENLQILCPNCHTQTYNYSRSRV